MNEKYYYKLTTNDDNTIFNNPFYCELMYLQWKKKSLN